MRRFIALLVLALLPLQWSYAAVAAYCGHEVAPQVQQHLGHHQASAESIDLGDGGKPSDAADCCVICHLSCTKASFAPAMVAVESNAPAAPPTGLENGKLDHLPDSLFRPPQGARLTIPA